MYRTPIYTSNAIGMIVLNSQYHLLDNLVVAGFECGRSRVQSPVKDRGIPKTL